VDGWDPYKAADTLAKHFCSEKGVMLLNLSSYQEQIEGNELNGSFPDTQDEQIRNRIHEYCVVPIRAALQEKIETLI